MDGERVVQVRKVVMKLDGKVALITGSTDGVGRVVAQGLAAAGARILIQAATPKEANVWSPRSERPAAALNSCRLIWLACRSATPRRYRSASGKRLDILVNNAGIGTAGTERLTSIDGHELRFAINYLAGFLLTHLLLPLIKTSTPARIVNVSSAGQQAIDFDDVMLMRGFSGRRAYCQSKLAQIMFTIDLAQELDGSGVIVNALHPATYMNTSMVRRAGVTPMSSVEEGAEAILNLAASPGMEGRSGRYFNGLREARADGQTYDETARRRLRAISLELTGLVATGNDGAPRR